jgi:16S rRNA pseudouridine516 synthase
VPPTTPSRRLDQWLGQARGLSRANAQRAIRRGEVRVDGETVTDPGRRVDDRACIEYAGEPVVAPQPRYFMVHKPAGVVCATEDRQHRTVLDLIDVANRTGLHPAGRLDIDATGLVLVTDDGEWSHRVTAPRHKVPKAYRVTLAEPLTEAAAQALAAGVQLRGEPKGCAPAHVERLGEREIRLTLGEGKYHQVKRMLAAVGNHVTALHRERIGTLVLDLALPAGSVRPLTVDEINIFTK